MVWPLCLWLVVVAAIGFFVARGQALEREALVDRTQNRAAVGASFVAAYVDDVFTTEQRLADRVEQPGWQTSDFPEDSEYLGFPDAVLLDGQGRVASLTPAAPQMQGVNLAQKYEHLEAALAGTPTVSDVVPSAAEGTPIVAFAMPVNSRFAVLSGAFSLTDSPLVEFLERQPIAGTHGVLLDSTGEVIVSEGQSASDLATRLFSQLQRSPDEPIVTDDRVVVAASVPGTGWTYVLDTPRKALLSPAAANNMIEWVLLGAFALLALGGIAATQRVAAAREKARTEKEWADQRLRLTVEHAPIGMALVDLDHRYIEPNRRLCEMLGYSTEELTRLTFEDVTHPDDVAIGLKRLDLLVAGETESVEMEKRYVRSDGSLLWGRLSVSVIRRKNGDPAYFVKQVEDITEMRRTRDDLRHRALYDPLTTLANRSLLMDRLTAALDNERHGSSVGVAFCDIDHFKNINDTHGHKVGDEVLKVVARRLQQAVRANDTVARLGGDEFVILFDDVISPAKAAAVVERANCSIKEPVVIDGVTIRTSLSGGLAFAIVGTDPDTLLHEADAALYAAKNAGRGRIEMRPELLRRRSKDPSDGHKSSAPDLRN